MTLDQALAGERDVLAEALAQPRVRRQAFLHRIILAGLSPHLVRVQPIAHPEASVGGAAKATAQGRVVEIHLDRRATVDRTILQYLDAIPAWRRSRWLHETLVNGYAAQRALGALGESEARQPAPAPVLGDMLRAPKAPTTPEAGAVSVSEGDQLARRGSPPPSPVAPATVVPSVHDARPEAVAAPVAPEIPSSTSRSRVRSSTEQILLDVAAPDSVALEASGDEQQPGMEPDPIPPTVVKPARALKGLFE